MVATPLKEPSQRSSRAWDCSRTPTRGILKVQKKPSLSPKIIELPDDHEDAVFDDILKQMDSLMLVAQSSPVKTTVAKHYQSYDFEDAYDLHTPLTIKFSLTKERLDCLIKKTSAISFDDVFPLYDMLQHVSSEAKSSGTIYNTYYCDAYWLFKYLDVIVTNVLSKFNLTADDEVMFDPRRQTFDGSEESRLEQTHIIKDHLAHCDWVATSLSSNSRSRSVPDEIKTMFDKLIKKLSSLLTDEGVDGSQSWIDYACSVV